MYYPFDSNQDVSLLLFFDNRLGVKAANYINHTGQFYYQNDPKNGNNYSVYQAKHPQFIVDQSVLSGINTNVLSGVYVNNTFSGHTSGNMMIDYYGGRVFIPGSGQNNLSISGQYYYKEINVYLGNTEAQLWLERVFNGLQNPYVPVTGLGPLQPRQYIAPCVVISPLNSQTLPFALGGAKTRTYQYTLTSLCATPYESDCVRGVISDMVEQWVPIIAPQDFPLNYFGDVKSIPSGFNYNTLQNQYSNNGSYKAYIKKTRVENMKMFRGKLINFQQFFYNTANVQMEVYNYFTP